MSLENNVSDMRGKNINASKIAQLLLNLFDKIFI